MEWIAYCTVCGELGRAPNGAMMESLARIHRRDTGHMTIIGHEPSIIMGEEMVEVPMDREDRHYWEVTNMTTGKILQEGIPYRTIAEAVNEAQYSMDTKYTHFAGDHLVIKIFDKSPAERSGITHTPEYTESYWVSELAGGLEREPPGTRLVGYGTTQIAVRPGETPQQAAFRLGKQWGTGRLFPETYSDWVDLALSIKERMPEGAWGIVNNLLQVIAEGGPEAEEAKRWLVKKAGELGIT